MIEPKTRIRREERGPMARLTHAADNTVKTAEVIGADRPAAHSPDSQVRMPLNELLYHVLFGTCSAGARLLQE